MEHRYGRDVEDKHMTDKQKAFLNLEKLRIRVDDSFDPEKELMEGLEEKYIKPYLSPLTEFTPPGRQGRNDKHMEEIKDYTLWRREQPFYNKSVDEIADEAVRYAKEHPHKGKARRKHIDLDSYSERTERGQRAEEYIREMRDQDREIIRT